MTTLHAQPYDISATGFYFTSLDEYHEKADALRNSRGDPVEEFEIQFIDGEAIDCELAGAIGLHQGDLSAFFDRVETWDKDQKINVIIAVGEGGYSASWESCDPDGFDLDIYGVETLRELAEQFVDEGIYGDIPKALEFYIDYDAIARDLGMEFVEATVAGERLVYRCG